MITPGTQGALLARSGHRGGMPKAPERPGNGASPSLSRTEAGLDRTPDVRTVGAIRGADRVHRWQTDPASAPAVRDRFLSAGGEDRKEPDHGTDGQGQGIGRDRTGQGHRGGQGRPGQTGRRPGQAQGRRAPPRPRSRRLRRPLRTRIRPDDQGRRADRGRAAGLRGGVRPYPLVSATRGPRRIAVVPHTHWDREWYEPFQTFRLKLVRLIDGLLDQMERDSSYTHFLLDGQVAVIDDYLEIRPENEQRLRALATAGRITIGPWYILMDEFLVSGETIVRNLQAGLRRGADFGGVMEVGYLPDMFGHVAQMPQILSLAGFERAVVWRGVPSAIDRSAFRWDAPDGSSVRAE